MPTSPQPLNVGLVGYGFMGAAHSHAWRTAHRFFDLPATPVLHTIAGRTGSAVAAAAQQYGFARHTTRWQDLIEDPEIHVIDICTPGDTHHEIALAALAAGKHVLCEKPLANSVAESEEMAAAATEAAQRGIRSICGFSYRRTPALAYAKQLVEEGFVGEIRQVRAQYLQDWLADADAPMTWRLDREKAGSGALGDIGAHVIDLLQWISGLDVAAVSGTLATVVPTRPAAGAMQGLGGKGDTSGERQQVTVDDTALFSVRLENGVLGAVEATRMAQGRKNAMRVEINGSKGSVAFDFERMNELEIYDATAPAGRQGFTRVLATEPEHPYAAAWWPTGHGLGYEHTFTHEVVDLVRAIGEGADPSPSFAEALHVQRVLAAVEASHADGSRWTPVGPQTPTTQETSA
ncbi:Gfo/Idh/MocA family oxidoreductase [Brachybacterium sp. J144]|uniref:Gfo/Idh/MocA family protein n=1 Tax=Brachybacterium sp. J144 TaxID=3116487 RepID=UPI002E76F7B2|nr:Gfo/Idh/MocA family oxidoreductase [Brachybacterium sp. J144]MEE1650207.1 Gfo/Idh/MocA family oxidoreductase [Brachybacterium sp. J144]